jgi:membrane protease subunit HflK
MRRVAAIFVLGLLGYLATGFTQIRPGERGVVRRFGRVISKPGPGLWIGLPVGLERVDRVAIDQVRRVRVGYEPETADLEQADPPGQLLSGDHNLVNVQASVDYAIRDEEVEDFVVNSGKVEGAIARATEAVIADWLAGRRVDDVLLHGKAELPEHAVSRTQTLIKPYRLGVHILGVSIPYLSPPEEVKSAFDDVTRAQTGIRTREHEARQEAIIRLREAQAEAERIRRLAGAYVSEQTLAARTDAASFRRRLAQYQVLRKQNPHMLASIWWDEIGKLLTRLKDNGRLDLLDNRLGADGLDIITSPPLPNR